MREKTNLQQNELDKVERRILITLFGNELIPESSAIGLKLLGINPNDYVQKFEKIVLPLMNDEGMIDGSVIRKIIQVSKYRDIADYVTIPDGNFFLSDLICNIIGSFLPGVIL